MSVIKPKPYREREKYSNYKLKKTLRSEICNDIDLAMGKNPKSFEELLYLLEENYEIKRGKNIALKGRNQKRFIRISSLGEGYSEKELRDIFENSKDAKLRKAAKKEFDLLIDIQEKLLQGKGGGYQKWATVYNIKQMAQTLLFLQERDVRTYEQLSKMTTDTSERFHELSQNIKIAEKRLGEIAVLRTHIINYSKTREVYIAYRKSGYSKKFFESHREELTLHKAAKEAFSKISDKKIPKVKELNEEYVYHLKKKKVTCAEYRQAKKEMTDYVKAKHNVDAFLKMQDSKEERIKQNRERVR